MKARIPDRREAVRRAIALPSKECGHLFQVDTYFTPRHGRLKLREINAASAELIFYTREESTHRRFSLFERCPVPDPVLLKALLSEALGVRGVVAKDRHLFLFREATRIHLDEVDRLGAFIEFEVPVSDDDSAHREMDLLMAHFGILPSHCITSSYIDLLEGGDRG